MTNNLWLDAFLFHLPTIFSKKKKKRTETRKTAQSTQFLCLRIVIIRLHCLFSSGSWVFFPSTTMLNQSRRERKSERESKIEKKGEKIWAISFWKYVFFCCRFCWNRWSSDCSNYRIIRYWTQWSTFFFVVFRFHLRRRRRCTLNSKEGNIYGITVVLFRLILCNDSKVPIH